MADRVPYHHPDDHQYSLTYVTRDRGEIDTDGIVERYEFDDAFFVLYTNSGGGGTVDDIDDEFEEVLDGMTPENRIITVRLLQIFEGVVEVKALEEDEELEIYKQIELERVPDALDRVDWSRSAVETAGQIMSTLVLKHALPNANHRTSISLAEWYLESVQSGFSLPDLATDDHTWMEWVDEYIEASKQLLTVRRNTTAFSLLQEWGCDVVRRKGGVDIHISEYDLGYSRSEAFEQYGEAHTELCTEFVTDSVRRAGHEELLSMAGPTRVEFAEYLEEAD